MQIVVATDIHGTSDSLRSLLSGLGNPIVLSPWLNDGCPFPGEQEAVAAFHRNDGLTTYQQQIAETVNGQPSVLIGFSVGATSMWHYIASTQCNAESRAVLYYGSRIRNSLKLVPRCSASVIFAEHERSFDPCTIVQTISDSGVDCSIIADTHHGFMNPVSANYRPEIAQAQINMLKSLLPANFT